MAYVYTAQEFEEIKTKYAAGVSLETLAEDYNKSVASVRMKLVKAGVYQKAEKPAASTKATSVAKTSSSSGRMSKSALTGLAQRMRIMLRDCGPSPV